LRKGQIKSSDMRQKTLNDIDKNKSLSQPLIRESDIAVIGIACNYPGAHNPKELWENILARRVQFRRMLDQRLPLKDYHHEDPKFPDKSYLTKAAFIDGFRFEWSKLRIPKKTFESTDIVHWLALDTALKAFEDAGYQFENIPLHQFHSIPAQNTGVILGNTLTGEQTRSLTLRLRWPYVHKALNATLEGFGVAEEERSRLSEAMEKVYKSAFSPVTEDSLAGGLSNTIAGRICNYLNLKGGGYVVDGACSSSLLAIATAANALRLKEMDLVLAGGVDVSLDPFELVGFSKAGALAKDQMRVYDQRASGFVPGEGCGFVVLKRAEDALRDKNYIYAVIKGWGISSDGKGGIMEPSSSGQATAIQRAYALAGYTLADVDFIEGHGTGTTKGDKVELGGIATALKQTQKSTHGRILGVTSFKSIVGHTKAAAGIGGFIKAVLAVNQKVLPPTANCQQPNEIFENEAKQLYPLIHGKICSSGKIIRAGISSAGFGGINCHITIESKSEPDKKIKPDIEERALMASHQSTEVFVFASKTVTRLQKLIKRFKEDLRNISMAEMADLSARLNKKTKLRVPIKIAIATDSPEHLYEALSTVERELELTSLQEGQILEVKSSDPTTYILLGNRVQKNRIGFLYSGQGSQRLNMTRTLVDRFDWARDLLKITNVPLADYIYKSEDQALTKEGREEFQKKLAETEVTQPAVTFSSLVWSEFLSRMGIEPDAVGGHSLGELAAFHKAGAFDQKTLLKFSEFRGQQMSGRNSLAGMVSLSCDFKKAESIVSKVGGKVVVSNMNSPNQTVVSGELSDIEKVITIAQKENIATYLLPVSNAFHSSFMNSASKKIASTRLLNGLFKPGKISLFSCVHGKQIKSEVHLREYFSKQVLSPVNFIGVTESMSEKCDLFIEVGPGRILTDLVKAINKDKGPHCFPVEGTPQNDRDLNIVLAQLFVRNVKINWQELYRNRAIKPFVPASRKKFIENQCERPLLKGVEQKEIFFSNLAAPMHAEAAQRQPFDIDQDKAQLPAPVISTPAPASADSIAKVLLDLTHKMTGFDEQSLNLNLRLLDDLNLDSIKAAELIAEAAKTLGVPGEIEPAQYSNKTLDEIRQKFEGLVADRKEGKNAAGSQVNILKRYSDKAWVRNFIERFESKPLKEEKASRISKDILIIFEDSEEEIAEALKETFKDSKARMVSADKIDITEKPECVIAILSTGLNALTMESLRQRMETLHKIIAVAANSKDALFAQSGSGDFKKGWIRAIASTLHLERPDLRLKIIDFNKGLKSSFIAKQIEKELRFAEVFSIAGYNGKSKRQVPIFELSNPVLYKKRDIQWSKKDVVFVTGGAKGITAECALEFGRMAKAVMVLAGRSAKDDDIEKTLMRFRKENLTAEYFKCDVADNNNVKKTIAEIERQFGPITAVIHGAGLNNLKRLKQADLEDVYKESLPKIMGAVHVLEAVQGDQLKLVVPMASIIGVTGMEGSGWYGFANEALIQYLRDYQIKNKRVQIIAPAFSVWHEVGMGVRLGSVEKLSERGIGAIPLSEGVKRFRELIARDPQTDQVIITSRVPGLDTMQFKEFKPRQSWRFIEEIKYYLPQVELIAQANLNVKDDPYLLDHNWKGSLLFPVVFGLEAMVQAVVYLTGREALDHFIIRDVNLERPISVNPESETIIEIHVQVLELNGRDTSQKIKVEIRSEQTNFTQPHFSAVIELAEQKHAYKLDNTLLNRSKNIIDLDPQLDLYGPILFQGKMFQRIEKIHELFYDVKTGKGECLFTSGFNQSPSGFLKTSQKFGNRFLIGDPFFIDSVLQSMQLIATQEACLPNFIEEIEICYWDRMKANGELVVKSRLEKISEQFLNGNAQTFYNNDSVMRIKNCRLKIMEHLSRNPLANDLVNPDQRDNKIFNAFINKVSTIEHLMMPKIYFTFWRDFTNQKKDQRKLIIKQWLEQLGYKNRNEINLAYSKDNKPINKSPRGGIAQISISHKGNYLVLSLGETSQGVDIEDIQKRNINEWHSILHATGKSVLNQLLSIGTDLNVAGTCAWSIVEILYKAVSRKEDDINYEGTHNGIYVFSSKLLGKDRKIIAGLLELTRGVPKICTFIADFQSMIGKKVGLQEQISSDSLKSLGFTTADLCGINAEYTGPQGQLVFKYHFPVTFKHNQLFSKNVYFTNYFDFCGTLREYSVFPILKDFLNTAKDGKTSMVTKMTSLDVHKPVQIGDIIEGRLWMESLKGQKKSTMNMFYEWYVVNRGKVYKVADCRQDTIWIKLDHTGKAEIDEYPPYLKKFVNLMGPKIVGGTLPDRKGNKSFDIYSGEELDILGAHLPSKYRVNQKLLTATLENSNLLSNIYFSSYAKWIGQLSDEYFYQCLPDFYSDYSGRKEIFCSHCSIDYTNECFPFDQILIEMFVERVFENGIELYFEFHKVRDDKKIQKLAYAKQQVLFVSIFNNGMTALNTPDTLIKLIKGLRT